MSRALAAASMIFAIAALAACVQQADQVAPPTGQSASAAPTAAAVNASVQRAMAEAERAGVVAQAAEAAARRGQDFAARVAAAPPPPGQVQYRGERPSGTRTVHGVAIYPDGSRYEGQFIGLQRNGSGIYIAGNGTRYAGDWREGTLTGSGAAFREGVPDRYDGEWLAGKRHGYGVQVLASRARYAGEFRADQPQGLGVILDPSGKVVLSGLWDSQRQPSAASPAPAPPAGARQASFGSGFIVSANGAVVTNEHVVRGCSRIEVRQEDGSFVPATLTRADAAIDVALIDIERPVVAVATFRDSASLREGEEIVVYGFPFAAQVSPGGTVTSGIVSSLFGPRGAAHQLQITAPVQIGNSGGPLLDRQGRVVGIVQSKLNALSVARATGDLPQNVNFAVKAAPAMTLMRGAGMTPAAAGAQAGEKRIADIVETAKRFTVLVRCQR